MAAVLAVAAVALAGCGDRIDRISTPGSTAPPTQVLPAAVNAGAVIADATNVPPPSQISPLARTLKDDVAIIRSYQALDIAATAADTILAVKPSFRGTPAASRLAAALDGARTWLNAASAAQRAGQADSYVAAAEQASAALAGVRSALADLKVTR